MKRDSKKALYESIMTSVAKEVKKTLNESNIENNMNDFIYTMLLGEFNKSINIDRLIHNPKFLRKIAGYIVEERVKDTIRYAFPRHSEEELPRYIDGGENWWDFELDGEKVEIKAFQKGKMFSNMHATKNQVDHKDEIIFMLVEYIIVNDDIEITGIAIVDGSELEFDNKYNRLVNNGNIQFIRQ